MPKVHSQALTIGIGSIGPKKHLASKDYGQGLVDSLVEDLAQDSDLYKKISLSVPTQCGDGRTSKISGNSAIGGTFSLVIADALGSQRFYGQDLSAAQHAEIVYRFFKDQGFVIGGHDDDHSVAPNSGCGGTDRLDSIDPLTPGIIQFISSNGDAIRGLLYKLVDAHSGKNLGLENIISSTIHEQIVSNARQLHERILTNKPYATNGNDLKSAMLNVGGKNSIDTLKGQHLEVAAVLDFRKDFALDRASLSKKYKNLMQSFYVNVASLKYGAGKLHPDNSASANLTFIAAVYYNLAATAVLADDSLRLICLS